MKHRTTATTHTPTDGPIDALIDAPIDGPTDAPTVDQQRRRTLKGMGTLGASGLIAGMPAVSAASALFKTPSTGTAGVAQSVPIDIEATLISSPDVLEDTLILRNLTGKEITVTRFHAGRVVFDGGIVDCNDACETSSITVPVGREVSVQITPRTSAFNKSSLASPAGDYLDVHAQLERLPNGTRVVPMAARMRGGAAVLTQRS